MGQRDAEVDPSLLFLAVKKAIDFRMNKKVSDKNIQSQGGLSNLFWRIQVKRWIPICMVDVNLVTRIKVVLWAD